MTARPGPPAVVVLAAVGAMVGTLPAVLAALVGLVALLFGVSAAVAVPFSDGWSATDAAAAGAALLRHLQLSLLAMGSPVLLFLGAVDLLAGRNRLLLVLTCLPVTAFAVRRLVDEPLLAGHGATWLLAVLAGPALAPLLALLPPARRWVASGPRSGSRRRRVPAS
ncbi:UNVERIFIED_ORG: hypothetical protein E4P37_05450 [Bacillus sp. AZ43]